MGAWGFVIYSLSKAIQIAQHIEDIAADLLRSLRSVPGLWLDRDTGAKALFNQLTDRFFQLLRWQCIGTFYTLKYDEAAKSTSILPGYFGEELV